MTTDTASRLDRMQAFVDALWSAKSADGWSWLGFYSIDDAGSEMLLGPCRDTPACTPIGLHGMCGRSFKSGHALIVRDVHAHGEDHIVCDPRNLSEFVVPLIDESGATWGVFDVDSHTVDHFSETDVLETFAALVEAGLTQMPDEPLRIETI